MILTLCPHHLILVLQVRTDVGRERELLNEINIDVAKNEISDVTKGERDVINDPSVDQEGSWLAMIFIPLMFYVCS